MKLITAAAPEDTCGPLALSDADGPTTEVERAGRPTRHGAEDIRTTIAGKRRTCILVWRDGMLKYPGESVQLTVLQLALMRHDDHPPA